MNVDPFWLHDRVLPSEANDPQEVARLGRALAEVGEDPGDLSRPAVTAAARRFQDSRGLKVDGVVQVNGPTAQRIAAERHERQTAARPARPRRVLGEQQAVPVRESVGPGGQNRAEDRASTMRGLALGGYFSRFGALNPLQLEAGAADPELERALARFRSKQGIRETGPLAPGSDSLTVLNRITAPRLHAFLNDDPTSVPQPPEQAAVVRDSPDSPTARAVPSRDEARESHEAEQDREIASRQARHVKREMDAVERGETAPPPLPRPDPVARALKDDPSLKDMTPRQLDRIRELGKESDLDLLDASTRERVGRYMREHEPDFLTALEERYREGRISLAKLERQAEMQTRRLSTHGANPIAVARQDATLQVLKQAMMDEGAEAREALARVEALMESNGQGDEDLPLLLEFVPGVGELISATEAAKYLAEARAAERDGNDAQANAAWTAFALAVGGAVPVLGKAVKLLRHINVVKKAEERITRTTAPILNAALKQARKTKAGKMVEEAIDAQRARKEILERENDFKKPFESKSAQELFGDEAWSALDGKTQHALNKTFDHIKGVQGEVFLKKLIERARLEAPMKDTRFQRRVFVNMPGENEPLQRHFDEITTGKIKPILGGMIVWKTKGPHGTGYEIKVASSKLNSNQKTIDDAIKGGAAGTTAASEAALAAKKSLPAEIDSVRQLRIPIWSIPQGELADAMRTALREKGVPGIVINQFEERLDIAYKLQANLEKSGANDIGDALTIAAIIGVPLLLVEDETPDA